MRISRARLRRRAVTDDCLAADQRRPVGVLAQERLLGLEQGQDRGAHQPVHDDQDSEPDIRDRQRGG